MRRIIEIDRPSRRAVVEPGVINLAVSQGGAGSASTTRPIRRASRSARSAATSRKTPAARTASSTASRCNHVTGLRGRHSRTASWSELGGGTAAAPGYDLTGAVHRLGGHARHRHRDRRPAPAGARGGHDAAGRIRRRPSAAAPRSSEIIAAGIVPAAIEMMDALPIEAAEAAVPCRISGWRRRRADRRAGRAEPRSSTQTSPVRASARAGRRVRDRGRRRPGRAGADLEGAQVARSPPSAGSAPTTSCRTASCRGPRCPRC